MGKFSRFKGNIKFVIDDEVIEVKSLTVGESDKLMKVTQGEVDLDSLINIISDILMKAYPEENREEIEAFALKYNGQILEELLIGMGWTTREKVAEQKKKIEDEALAETKGESDKKKE